MISVLYFPLARVAFGGLAAVGALWGVFLVAGWYVGAHDRGYWRGWRDAHDPIGRRSGDD